MVDKNLKASEIILLIGKELYGDNFSLDYNGLINTYKTVYNSLIIGLNNKSKGILLIGNIGVGKTALMKIMQRLFKDTDRRFRIVTSTALKDLSEELKLGEIKEMYGYGLKNDLYIDDIGFMSSVKVYGNSINIITEIIMDRYDLFISTGYKTHFSSNIVTAYLNNNNNYPSIENVYGARVLDRMKQMCNLVNIDGKSLRK